MASLNISINSSTTAANSSAVSSSQSSPRSVASIEFGKFERRMSLDNLLKEANLDRGALLSILKEEKTISMKDLDTPRIQSIIDQAS